MTFLEFVNKKLKEENKNTPVDIKCNKCYFEGDVLFLDYEIGNVYNYKTKSAEIRHIKEKLFPDGNVKYDEIDGLFIDSKEDDDDIKEDYKEFYNKFKNFKEEYDKKVTQ